MGDMNRGERKRVDPAGMPAYRGKVMEGRELLFSLFCPVGEGTGSGPAWPALNLTIIKGQMKMQKATGRIRLRMTTGQLDGTQRGGAENYPRKWATLTSKPPPPLAPLRTTKERCVCTN